MKRVYLPAEIFDLNRGQAGEGRFILGDAEPVEFLLKFLNKFHDLHQKAVRRAATILVGVLQLCDGFLNGGKSFCSQGKVSSGEAGFWMAENSFVLSSIRLDGEKAFTTYQGGTTGERFVQYLKEILLPTLRPGNIVTMDNMRSHHVKKFGKFWRKGHGRVVSPSDMPSASCRTCPADGPLSPPV